MSSPIESGTTWVLLRGLAREARHWGDFPERFGTRVGAARVIALDLPGNGTLHGQRSPASVDAMAEHVRAELARRGLAPPFQVLAMSLGAMVACAWAAHHPREIGGAVLVNTSLRPFSRLTQRLRPRQWPVLMKLLLSSPSPRERERAVLQLTSRVAGPQDALLDAWARYRRDAPVTGGNALRQLWAAARYRAAHQAPATPMLALCSAADALVDPRCSARLARAWGCPIATHPWAGHDLPLDDGEWVAAQVEAWLRQRASDSGTVAVVGVSSCAPARLRPTRPGPRAAGGPGDTR
jgi:pimeloyl-ACP methyl ester carboxylesterase